MVIPFVTVAAKRLLGPIGKRLKRKLPDSSSITHTPNPSFRRDSRFLRGFFTARRDRRTAENFYNDLKYADRPEDVASLIKKFNSLDPGTQSTISEQFLSRNSRDEINAAKLLIAKTNRSNLTLESIEHRHRFRETIKLYYTMGILDEVLASRIVLGKRKARTTTLDRHLEAKHPKLHALILEVRQEDSLQPAQSASSREAA